jgi:hypothetical protein
MNEIGARRGIDWDRVTGLSALVVSVVAVVVAAYTAVLQRDQISAQVWPRMLMYNAGKAGEFHVANKGMGPAIVRNVRVEVDGKPVADWGQVIARLGLPADPQLIYSSLNGMVLAPGEDVAYLRPSNAERFAAIRQLAGERWNVHLCYCSALDECWVVESHPRNVQDALREVAVCPAAGAGEFTE